LALSLSDTTESSIEVILWAFSFTKLIWK